MGRRTPKLNINWVAISFFFFFSPSDSPRWVFRMWLNYLVKMLSVTDIFCCADTVLIRQCLKSILAFQNNHFSWRAWKQVVILLPECLNIGPEPVEWPVGKPGDEHEWCHPVRTAEVEESMAPLSAYPLTVLQWAIVLKNRHLPGPIHTTQLNHDHRGMCLSMTEVEWVLLTQLKPTTEDESILSNTFQGAAEVAPSDHFPVTVMSISIQWPMVKRRSQQATLKRGRTEKWVWGVVGGGAYFRWKRLSKDIHKILNYEWLNVMFT